MRNLKRVLSLVMAVAMLVGLMVVSASAAGTYEDFTDKDEIVNTEAVQTMVSLGVINGKEDGSYFDPDGTVTRAEMAKLIAVCLNGGKDPLLGTGAVVTNFSDVPSTYWAAPYIAFCANLGIINGKGDGTFGPEEPVTGTAAAKMMLTALGYRSEIEGLTGAGWDLNSDTLANKVGLYNGMNIVPSNGLSRDDTAQLIYNGVQAEEVVYRNNYGEYSGVIYAQPVNGTGNNAESSTMLWVRFKVQKVEGVVVANDVFSIKDSGAKAPDGKARLEDTEVYGYRSGNIVTADGTYTVEISNDYVGRRVVLYVQYKDYLSPNAVNSVVVGVPILSDKNTVATTTDKLKDNDAVKSFATKNGLSFGTNAAQNYKGTLVVDANGTTVAAGVPTESFGVQSNPGVEYTFIDHNGDSVIDYAIKVTDTLAKVSVYDEKNEKMTIAGAGSIDFTDAVGYEGLAKNDMVLYHKLNETYYVYPAETVSGTVTAYDKAAGTIEIDGTGYKKSNNVLENAGTALTSFDTEDDLVGDGYTLYLDRAGYVVGKAVYEETVGNYALVLKSATSSGIGSTGEVKLLKADGTTATHKVNLVATYNKLNGMLVGNTATSTTQKEKAVLDVLDLNAGGAPVAGKVSKMMFQIVTYTVNSANEVTLGTPETGDYKAVQNVTTTSANVEAGRSNNSYTFSGVSNTIVPNNSTIYFFYNWSAGDGATNADIKAGCDGEATVAVGLNSLPDKIDDTRIMGAVYYDNSTAVGRNTAKVLFVDGEFQGAKNYVYVSDDYRMELNANGDRVYVFPVVTTEGEASTVKVLGSASGITKGNLYEYTLDSEGYAELTTTNHSANPTEAYEVNGFVTNYADNGDTTVLRVSKGTYEAETRVYSVADDVKIYNVEDTDNIYEETLSDGMKVSFAVDADGYVTHIFVSAVDKDFRNVKVTAASVTVEMDGTNPGDNNWTATTGQTFSAANGYKFVVTGLTPNGTFYYDVFEDGEDPISVRVTADSNGKATITMPENADIDLTMTATPTHP